MYAVKALNNYFCSIGTTFIERLSSVADKPDARIILVITKLKTNILFFVNITKHWNLNLDNKIYKKRK